MAETVVLPARLDVSVLSQMHADLRAHSGQDLILDLRGVTYLGALALQLIIAAARQARSASRSFALRNINDRVLAQMHLLGTAPETIMEGQP